MMSFFDSTGERQQPSEKEASAEDALAKQRTMPSASDIRLACGEMTPKEMNLVMCVLGWFVNKQKK